MREPQQKRALEIVQVDADKGIRDLIFPLGQVISDSVLKHTDGAPVTPLSRDKIMRDVDVALATVFGERRGAPSALEDLIAARANDARLRPAHEAATQLRAILPPKLVEAMKKG